MSLLFLFASSRCLAFFAAFCGSLPCLFCGGSRPCPFWNFLLPAPCLFLRPFSGAFHVGCPSLFFPPSRAFRGGKRGGAAGLAEALQLLPSAFPSSVRLFASLPGRKRDVAAGLADALPLLPFVACSPLGCPVAFVPLERSCRSEKKEVALPLLPFAVRLPSSRWKGRQDGRGRYCLFATFSSSPSPSPAAPFASLPGRKGPLRRAGFGSVSTAPLRRLSFFALPANLPGRKRGVATG